MLLKFYLCGMMFYGLGFLMMRVTRDKDVLASIITLIVLFHLLCGVLWAGSTAFLIVVGMVLVVAISELGTHYTAWYTVPILGVSLGVLSWLVRSPHVILLFMPVFFLLSLVTCLGTPRVLQHGIFFAGFSISVLTVSAASLIALYKTRSDTILILVLLLHLNDAFGCTFGKKFGRHKPFKTLSPGKSLEGYLGSILGLVIGILVLHTLIPALQGQTLVQDVILLSFVYIAGNLGDLFFSRIKRHLGIKDFSRMLPGHGGILDRMDNLFFSAPLFYVLIACHVL
ncbi:MAG: phosphatidate cytidylyltransferase [bacterium]|nr:phosphatidate cytidylyltransferase [bacterium]